MEMNIMKKSMLMVMLGICLLFVGNVKAEASSVKADATAVETEGYVQATVEVPEETVMSTVARIAANGEVDGDGVRLRAKASSTATVLELMYDGESVAIDLGNSVNKNGKLWYYLKRIKTGTWGYANSDYIIYY